MASNDLKGDFRKQIKSKLSQLSKDEIASQSERAQNLILGLPQYQKANRLSIYLSMPSKELQTTALVTHALENDKKVFVPYIHHPPGSKRKVIDMLRLQSLSDFESSKRDSWGIPSLSAESVDQRENAMGGMGLGDGEMLEPTEDGEGRKGGGNGEGTLDLVVMPGVAFDEGMNRLGHGGGFYDTFLARFCSDGTRKPYLGKSSQSLNRVTHVSDCL
jgi:5-formyltetrahydrofolate cyclo-ligase